MLGCDTTVEREVLKQIGDAIVCARAYAHYSSTNKFESVKQAQGFLEGASAWSQWGSLFDAFKEANEQKFIQAQNWFKVVYSHRGSRRFTVFD